MKIRGMIIAWVMALPLLLPCAGAALAQEAPWFVMSVRPVLAGSRSGSMTFNWQALGGLVDIEEDVDVASAGYFAIQPEALFMPTAGRGFIISAALPLAGGGGRFAETGGAGRVINEDVFNFVMWHLMLGLGYQWYFGMDRRTTLMLMSHAGVGTFKIGVKTVDEDGATDPLASMQADISVGSTYRFACNFTIGGSLDISYVGFSGETEGEEYWEVETAGGMTFLRLNALLGWSFF